MCIANSCKLGVIVLVLGSYIGRISTNSYVYSMISCSNMIIDYRKRTRYVTVPQYRMECEMIITVGLAGGEMGSFSIACIA
jgi:hypothetical protein